MLERRDSDFARSRGIDEVRVEGQLARFREGFPYLEIVRPASVGDGILRLDGERLTSLGREYEKACVGLKAVKFVPASGAATRMFKDLFEYLSTGKANRVTGEVLASLPGFAFYDSLAATLPEGASGKDIIGNIVGGGGLGYGEKPKALILFHRYPFEVRTALEEHLAEGAQYASCSGRVAIHFTVSPEHMEGFRELLAEVLPCYGERFGVEYFVTMSVQESTTDTVAVNPDNTPFRNDDGTLLFRPAGHGALIGNLNGLDADIVFIKNIDNVTTDSRRGDTVVYKKALAGLLLEVRNKTFDFLGRLEGGGVEESLLEEITDFARKILNIGFPDSFGSMDISERAAFLRRILDRPLRVCGMVRNEGEPGGGPFFARNQDGTVSLQVVESTQVAPRQAGLMKGATHFNPVDLVCSLRGYKGDKFDLAGYVDDSTGFISEKSKDGRPLKALELPGLWNGAMSDWSTLFVEVPITTFTPVKVVTDLLRPGHRETSAEG